MVRHAFIISYLGDTVEKQQERLLAYHNTLKWLKEQKHDVKIIVYWQNPAELAILGDHITYMKHPENQRIFNGSEARNVLLRDIYKYSDIDEFFLLDDDGLLKEGSVNPFEYVNETLPRLGIEFDCLAFVADGNGDVEARVSTLTKNARIWTGFIYLKNFKKSCGEEYYFDSQLNCHQDNDMGINLILNGKKVYMCTNPSSPMTRHVSVMFNGDRKERSLASKAHMTEKWNRYVGKEIINPNKMFNTRKLQLIYGSSYPNKIVIDLQELRIIEQK